MTRTLRDQRRTFDGRGPWLLGLIVGGGLLYYVPRLIRLKQGINIGFVYKELPPE